MIERQELHCHACDKYVQFDIDMEMDGNHVLTCPICSHEHCRVVAQGVITDVRWDQRNGDLPMYTIATGTVTSSITSIDTTSTGSSTFTTDMWLNSTSTSSTGYF